MANTTIVGLYDNPGTADDVIEALRGRDIERDHIHTVGHSNRDDDFGNDLIGGLTSHNVPDDEAHFYAEGVRRGGTLVILDVPRERVEDVSDAMNEHQPVQVDRRRERWQEEKIEMTETDEEVVDKQARQTGEVHARKTAEDRTEHVSETARHTEDSPQR